MATRKPVIAICGGGFPPPRYLALAEEMGRLIAESGWHLACGGRGGIMEAACMGAKSAGGMTLGILPGTSVTGANPHVDVVIPTGMGNARNAIVVLAGDVVVAIDGACGTLSEIALALVHGKDVVLLAAGNGDVVDMGGITIDTGASTGITVVETPAAAIEAAKRSLARLHGGRSKVDASPRVTRP